MTGFHKRVHSLGTFWAGLTDMVRHAPERHAIVRQQRLYRTFIEQLSLVVSRVNGCRLCTYVHAANALRSGSATENSKNCWSSNSARCHQSAQSLSHLPSTLQRAAEIPIRSWNGASSTPTKPNRVATW